MKKYLDRLADLILKEVEQNNYTYSYYADICDISRNVINEIISGKTSGLRMSTIKKICDSSSFNIEDIFEPRTFEDYISTIIVEKDGVKYKIHLEKVR